MFTIVTIYTPPAGMTVVHSWGPYADRRTAANAASRMRNAHKRDNAWMGPEQAKVANARLTLHTQEVSDPFEVSERKPGGEMVLTEQSAPSHTSFVTMLSSKKQKL